VLLLAVVWLHSLAGPVVFKERGVVQALVGTHRASCRRSSCSSCWASRESRTRAAARLAAEGDGGAGARECAAARRGGRQGGCVRHRPDRGRRVWRGNGRHARVLHPLAVAAGVTIVYGSVRALFRTNSRSALPSPRSARSRTSCWARRCWGRRPPSAAGHLVHQGIMKITLFFCAGTTPRRSHASRERDERRGPADAADDDRVHRGGPGHDRRAAAGRLRQQVVPAEGRDPGQRRVGGAGAGASSLLNAAYFLPILYRAWFNAPRRTGPPNIGSARGRRTGCCCCRRWSRPG